MNSFILMLAMTPGQPPALANLYPHMNPTALATVQPGTAPATGQPMPNGMSQTLPPNGNGNGNANGNGNGCAPCEQATSEAPELWALMRVLKGTAFSERLDGWGITISGWTQGNYTVSTVDGSNLPVTLNDRADFWQMNQNFLRIDRTTDPSKGQFQMGFRTELILPGTDARYTVARGLLNNQPGDYWIDLFQAYTETYHPNLGPSGTTLRIGKFATHCGYELVQGAETPFLSRGYLFQYNPFTHTGVWAITPLNDTWTISNGIVLGSDNFIGAPARPTYLGQLKWAPKEGKTTFLLNTVVTDPTFNAADNFAFYNYYGAQVIHKFTDKFTGVLDTAASHMDGIPGVAGAAWWYGAAGYGTYQINDKLSATLRAELFDDNKGVRTGFSGLYSEVTFGLAWSPVRSLILRPAVRYDHNYDSRPFEGKRDLFTAAMDMFVRW